MHSQLQFLKPGSRFRLAGMPEVTGELLSLSDCSATVRIDGGMREIEIENPDGTTRRFRAHRATTTTWAPATCVEPILNREDDASSHPEEFDMATKKTKKTKSPKAESTAKAKKVQPSSDSKEKKPSAIDAAAQVLAASKEPMNAKEMIDAMAAQGLWKSPGGKTPHATLFSAIIREISSKGKDARFVKSEVRGKFAAKS